jgi:tungstate transport system ATP-binding protein
LFAGVPIPKQDDLHYRRRMALVLQESLLLDQTVAQNVAIGLRFRGMSREESARRVNTWLARLGIDHLRDRPARKLSGGEAQRVSLARAFAIEPELLLLDEPFSSLDTPARLRLFDDLRVILAETKTTTIFITHNIGEARQLATKIAVILEGRLHQTGSLQDLFTSPANEKVAAFVEAQNML